MKIHGAAARFINGRIPGANVTPHFGKIQDKDAEFYQVDHASFAAALCCLAARRLSGFL
jgi:hypothetical protein